ncbi:MAG: arginine N-succinyltransferase [Betaproteobacteria bacterium]|nr:arginine N-succinyltransferase [Betaproteobacteria bacterium]
MLIRPIAASDLPALIELARSAGVGVTTLPPDEGRLVRRIEISQRSFSGELAPAHANYLFVLEDETQRRLAGTSGIVSAVGLDEPWYNYRVGAAVHSSREIGVYRQLQTLFLTNDLTGSSELCSLFLDPAYRRDGNGALLAKSRFLFLAEFRQRFAQNVIAELRGVSDARGRSPFWESLGRHFFQMDFSRADYLSGVGNKSFIAELMPQHPVYSVFLSQEAQAAIGEVHPATRPARAMLEAEGFRYQGYIDIFDAGPAVASPLEAIRCVRESIVAEACAGNIEQASRWLVVNRSEQNFRAVLASATLNEGRLMLHGEALRRLNIGVGDSVRAVRLSHRA